MRRVVSVTVKEPEPSEADLANGPGKEWDWGWRRRIKPHRVIVEYEADLEGVMDIQARARHES